MLTIEIKFVCILLLITLVIFFLAVTWPTHPITFKKNSETSVNNSSSSTAQNVGEIAH